MTPKARYLYWLSEPDFLWASSYLRERGFEVVPADLTACQVLRASEKRVVYAPPQYGAACATGSRPGTGSPTGRVKP